MTLTNTKSALINIAKALGFTAAGMSGYYVFMLPNTTFLKENQNFAQLYRSGEPVPVPPNIQKLGEDVLNDMKWSEENKQKVTLFTHSRPSFYYAGSVWEKENLGKMEKAIVGIPGYFYWDTNENLRKGILVFDNPMDWSSETGKKLLEACLLSDKAKKFAIAENFFYISKCEPLVKGIVTSLMIMLTVLYLDKARTASNLQSRIIRYAFYSLIIIFNALVWIALRDIYQCRLEGQADELIAGLGRSYIEGGLEYFESTINRNAILTSIAEQNGKKSPYTSLGNEKMFLRQKSLPLSSRRDYFKKLLD